MALAYGFAVWTSVTIKNIIKVDCPLFKQTTKIITIIEKKYKHKNYALISKDQN